MMLDNDSALYSQHIKGKQNFIADSLSRDHHLSNEQLTFSFQTLLPEQTPDSFEISQLPNEVASWVISLSRFSTKTQESPPQRCKKQLGCFDRWRRFLADNGIKDEWLAGFNPDQRTRLLSAFAGAVRRNMFGTREKVSYEDLRSKPPSRMYVRPSDRIFGQIQG